MVNYRLSRRDFIRRIAVVSAMHIPFLMSCAKQRLQLGGEYRLKRIVLKTRDIGEQVNFYKEVLRLPVEYGADVLRVTVGPSVIEFQSSGDEARPFYHFAFNIPENQLNSAMDWLGGRCPIATIRDSSERIMYFRNWDAHSCYFYDPAGNILEFIAHHPLRNGTTVPFTEEQILCVCEIGLVVPDVPKVNMSIGNELSLQPYYGSSDTFAALGDPYGMIIVAQENRIWLPTTNVKAKIFPTEVKLSGNQSKLTWPDLPYRIAQE
jgi:catechol-2,3-dioxygenase